MVDILKKELAMSFDDAVAHVEKLLTEGGFNVMLSKALDEMLKKAFGMPEYPRYTFILACSPELAKMGLEASFNVGLVYPCSFVVYEEDGKIIVSHASIMKIAKEVGLASAEAMDPVIEKTGKIVHAVWNRF
ncbi:MAG: DUF302 domain-containing protein [Candidatus Heimdallarchaeota archaeon]